MNRWKYVLVGLLVGAFAFPLVWNSDPSVIGQTVTVDSTQSPLVVNALADLADLTPTDGQSVIIKTGTEKGLWYYDKDSVAVVDSVAVLTGPGSVGRFLVINNDAGSVAAATAITAAQIDNDVDIEFGVFDADSPRSLTLAELKKTGVQVVNVVQKGADPTGVADSTAAFESAITAAGIGGVIYVPSGTFTLTDGITLLNRQTLRGSGIGTVLTWSANPSVNCVQMASYATLADMTIDGTGIGSAMVGVRIGGAGDGVTFIARGVVENVRITECGVGFAFDDCFIWALHDCYASTCGAGLHFGHGWLTGESNSVVNIIDVQGGEIAGCTEGIKFTGQGTSINIRGVTIEASITYGIHQYEVETLAWMKVNITECYFEDNGTAQIYLEDYARNWKIEGNSIAGGPDDSLVAIIGGSTDTGGYPLDTVIRGNVYKGVHVNERTVTINAEAKWTVVEWNESDQIDTTLGLVVTDSGINSKLKDLRPFIVFTADDATPSVKGHWTSQTANANPTTITALDDGFKGQSVTILINDANTTVDFTGTTLKGNNGVDWTPASGDHMVCTFNGTNWYCVVSEN